MAELTSGMPVLPLLPSCQVKFEAINPLTGVAVTGVTVSLATIYAAEAVGGDTLGFGDTGPFMLVPGPTPVATSPVKVKPKGGL